MFRHLVTEFKGRSKREGGWDEVPEVSYLARHVWVVPWLTQDATLHLSRVPTVEVNGGNQETQEGEPGLSTGEPWEKWEGERGGALWRIEVMGVVS